MAQLTEAPQDNLPTPKGDVNRPGPHPASAEAPGEAKGVRK